MLQPQRDISSVYLCAGSLTWSLLVEGLLELMLFTDIPPEDAAADSWPGSGDISSEQRLLFMQIAALCPVSCPDAHHALQVFWCRRLFSVDTNSLRWWMLLRHLTNLCLDVVTLRLLSLSVCFCPWMSCSHWTYSYCFFSCFGTAAVFHTGWYRIRITEMSFPKSIWIHHTVCWPTVWICRPVDLWASGSRPGGKRKTTLECISGSGFSYSGEKKMAQIFPGQIYDMILIVFVVNMQPGWRENTMSIQCGMCLAQAQLHPDAAAKRKIFLTGAERSPNSASFCCLEQPGRKISILTQTGRALPAEFTSSACIMCMSISDHSDECC